PLFHRGLLRAQGLRYKGRKKIPPRPLLPVGPAAVVLHVRGTAGLDMVHPRRDRHDLYALYKIRLVDRWDGAVMVLRRVTDLLRRVRRQTAIRPRNRKGNPYPDKNI